jgi:hypothetical protein
MLRNENARAIGEWLFKFFIYHWGTLVEIISDNGAPFIKAIGYLSKKYHINHIRISGYNSRANGIVERSHFDIRQALFKAAEGDQTKWSSVAHSVFWADRITVRKRMGCSRTSQSLVPTPSYPSILQKLHTYYPLPIPYSRQQT